MLYRLLMCLLTRRRSNDSPSSRATEPLQHPAPNARLPEDE